MAVERPSPRRVSRSRNRAFARANRLESVPSVTPSRAAACRRDRPSSSQSTMAARCRSGRRPSSSSRMARSSLVCVSSGGSTGRITPSRFSCDFCRAARARASSAVRRATPCSQLANCSRRAIAGALRARTRNAAWNASSAACRLQSTRRQTPRTIAPCRFTKAANAASADS